MYRGTVTEFGGRGRDSMEMTYEVLYRLYVNERRTLKEIADMFGYKSSQTIGNKLKKYNISTRGFRESQRPFVISKELLELEYLTNFKSCEGIAKQYNSSSETVRRLLHYYAIPLRAKTSNFGGNNKGKVCSQEIRKHLSEVRKYLYSSGKLRHWNIGNKTPLEVRKKISKSLLRGRLPAPKTYGNDWSIQRTSCLQRDDYTCQQCGCTDSLEVHHWTPYRFCYDNSLDNLVTLCSECHRWIHKRYIFEGFIVEAEEALYEIV